MARRIGIGRSSVNRIWRAFGLTPHRSDTFVSSRYPLLVEKVRDIVGLYLDPPDRALVLCVNEKSQIQALSRTQPQRILVLSYATGLRPRFATLVRGSSRRITTMKASVELDPRISE